MSIVGRWEAKFWVNRCRNDLKGNPPMPNDTEFAGKDQKAGFALVTVLVTNT
jgi:hypothetical protein